MRNSSSGLTKATTSSCAAWARITSYNVCYTKLLRLELDIPSTRTPLAIYSGTSDLSGEIATIIGWGKLSEYGKFATTLQEAQVPIVSNETCNDAYNKSFFYDNPITSTMLCAGYAQGGTDSCSGDSGGPLMINLDGEWNLAGLVSWGEGCAEPGYYGVYSRISALSRFIAQYVPAGIPSVRLWFPHIAVRITSYNVCYTKLCSYNFV